MLLVLSTVACDRPAGTGGGAGPKAAMDAEDPGFLWEIGDFELVDQGGGALGRDELLGSPWIGSFIFTACPNPCPKITAGVARLQKELEGTEARLVTISVDPLRDTPAVLAAYGEEHGADFERWSFLTGEWDAIEHAVKTSLFEPIDGAPGDVAPGEHITHSPYLIVIDALGRMRGRYRGDKLADQNRALARMRFLLEEESSSPEPGSGD